MNGRRTGKRKGINKTNEEGRTYEEETGVLHRIGSYRGRKDKAYDYNSIIIRKD